jgi:hypothetical protein
MSKFIAFTAGAIVFCCLVAVAREIHLKRREKRMRADRQYWR